MAPKSIWRSDKAQHFTLVHRSQQDPLLHDADASARVLKATNRKNQRTQQQGQSREELERELGDYARKQRANVGEAAQYGIFYDDTEYDYMQHLRAVGDDYNRRRGGVDEENDAEVIMLEAPKDTQSKTKAKAKADTGVQLRDGEGAGVDRKDGERTLVQLPAEVLPSEHLMPRTFEGEREKGIRPDMDPHLRQVLEALEDDAFLMRKAGGGSRSDVVEELEGVDEADLVDEMDDEGEEEEDIDDFFGGIVQGGELGTNEEEPEWRRLPPEGEESIWEDEGSRAAKELMMLKAQGGGVEDLSLESRVALFKRAQEEQQQQDQTKPRRVASSTGSKSIFGEKGPSRKSRHPGAKARLAGSYYAPSADGGSTAFSMSSSAMERNHGLTGLDAQFDRMEKIYEQDSDEDEESEDEEAEEDAGEPFNAADVEAIFDDFLNNNELVGNKLRERLGDRETTSSEKVDILRRELGDVRLVDKLSIEEAEDDRESYDEVISRDLKSREQARREWDVETVLTTRTNVENHPRTIASTTSHLPRSVLSSRANGIPSSVTGLSNRIPRARINPRTGVAEIAGYIDLDARQRGRAKVPPAEQGGDQGSDGSEASDDDGVESDASNDTEVPQNVTITRSRNETKEDKKARKQGVKEQRRAVREAKAARKSTYQAELSKQKRVGGGGVKQATAVHLS